MSNTINDLFPNRISFRFNDEEIASFGSSIKRPKNQAELIELLENIVGLIKAKPLDDKDLF